MVRPDVRCPKKGGGEVTWHAPGAVQARARPLVALFAWHGRACAGAPPSRGSASGDLTAFQSAHSDAAAVTAQTQARRPLGQGVGLIAGMDLVDMGDHGLHVPRYGARQTCGQTASGCSSGTCALCNAEAGLVQKVYVPV